MVREERRVVFWVEDQLVQQAHGAEMDKHSPGEIAGRQLVPGLGQMTLFPVDNGLWLYDQPLFQSGLSQLKDLASLVNHLLKPISSYLMHPHRTPSDRIGQLLPFHPAKIYILLDSVNSSIP